MSFLSLLFLGCQGAEKGFDALMSDAFGSEPSETDGMASSALAAEDQKLVENILALGNSPWLPLDDTSVVYFDKTSVGNVAGLSHAAAGVVFETFKATPRDAALWAPVGELWGVVNDFEKMELEKHFSAEVLTALVDDDGRGPLRHKVDNLVNRLANADSNEKFVNIVKQLCSIAGNDEMRDLLDPHSAVLSQYYVRFMQEQDFESADAILALLVSYDVEVAYAALSPCFDDPDLDVQEKTLEQVVIVWDRFTSDIQQKVLDNSVLPVAANTGPDYVPVRRQAYRVLSLSSVVVTDAMVSMAMVGLESEDEAMRNSSGMIYRKAFVTAANFEERKLIVQMLGSHFSSTDLVSRRRALRVVDPSGVDGELPTSLLGTAAIAIADKEEDVRAIGLALQNRIIAQLTSQRATPRSR